MVSYASFLLRSGNTMGYGIHSPHLFYIARVLLPETAQYYCFEPIEQWRRDLLRRRDQVRVVDYGTGKSGTRLVGEVARKSLKSRAEGQLLFRLVNYLDARMIVELGTCLGVTTAYLASPHSDAEVWTMEGSGELLKIAKTGWSRLGIRNIRAVEGNLDETLEKTAAAWQRPIDFALLDANHTGEATLRYFDVLARHASAKSVFVVDDIRRNKDMWQAWEAIGARADVTARMDLGMMGLVFFDGHLPKRVFRLRL